MSVNHTVSRIEPELDIATASEHVIALSVALETVFTPLAKAALPASEVEVIPTLIAMIEAEARCAGALVSPTSLDVTAASINIIALSVALGAVFSQFAKTTPPCAEAQAIPALLAMVEGEARCALALA